MRHIAIPFFVSVLLYTSGGLLLADKIDKLAPLNHLDLSSFSGKQLYEGAFKIYVCSFLMHLAGQRDEAQVLRSYSVHLMAQEQVAEYGKNWNDVNFPGSLLAFKLSLQLAEELDISQKSAAEKLFAKNAHCTKSSQATPLVNQNKRPDGSNRNNRWFPPAQKRLSL
jgi:hypothetical protein